MASADFAAARTNLGLVIGTDVQAFDAALAALAAGSDFVQFTGPTTSTKVFTLPNATSTILTTNAAVTVAQGGTGIASGTSGGIPYFSGTTTIASSGALAANAIVIGGGAGVAPATTTTGTGVLTALGINVGSAGAFTTFNGAGGTPSSLTLTNATGLPTAGLVNDAVTLAKIQNATANSKLLGSGAAGSGADYVEITLGTNLSMSGTTLNATGGAGGGDVSGPGSSTDNAIVLWDGTAGTLVQNSVITADPATGDIAGVGSITGGALSVTTITIGGVTASGVTGTGNVVFGTTPTITTPVFSGAFSGTYSLGGTVTFPTTVSLSTSGVLTTGTIELGAASDTTLARSSAGNVSIEGNVIYRAGGTDVAVADGGTGISSGTSGGVLAFTASGTIASSTALTANAIVIGGGAGVAPSTTTTGTGVLTVLGQAANGSNSDGVGYRGVPQNSQSAAYTTVMADSGKCIFHPSGDANARTFTIDSNANVAYPIGTVIEFENATTQNVTIAITSDTLRLIPAGTTGSRTLAQYGKAVAEKITSTEWWISGNSALT